MSETVAVVNVSTDTFQDWIDRTNALIASLGSDVVTVAANSLGGLTSGNGMVNGVFGANTVFVTADLRGGTLSTSAAINVSSNLLCSGLLSIGNSTLNVVSNSSLVQVTNSTNQANISPIGLVTGQTTLNSIALFVGNSLVNNFVNSSVIQIGANLMANSTTLSLGNSSVNASLNSTILSFNNQTYYGKMQVLAPNEIDTIIQPRINFIEGNNIFLEITEDSGDGQINVQINAVAITGSQIIGGYNQNIQFNDGSNFNGSNSFSFNKITNTISISNTLLVGAASLVNGSTVNTSSLLANTLSYANGSILKSGLNITIAGTSAATIDYWPIASYRAAQYFYTVKDETSNAYHTGGLHVLSDGTNGLISEFGVIVSNNDLGKFSASQNASHILVQFTSLSVSTTIKGARTLIPV